MEPSSLNDISIDDYVSFKNKMQDYINTLDQSKLLEVFHVFTQELPTVQYTKNKNGYFIDIKQLPTPLLYKIESLCLGGRDLSGAGAGAGEP